MQTLSEFKPSDPQNRGTKTLPPNSGRRKGADILTRVRIETPATQAGSSYALLPARLLCLPGGELLVLAVLLSMRRSNGTFLRPLTFGELARSLGFCGKTLGAHVASLRARGLVHGLGQESIEALLEAASGSWSARADAAPHDGRRPGRGQGRSGLPAPLPGHHSTQYGLFFRTGRHRRRGRGSSESPAPFRGREANARPRHAGLPGPAGRHRAAG